MTGKRMGHVTRTYARRAAGGALAALLLAPVASGAPAGLAAQEASPMAVADPEEAEAAAVALINELFDAMRGSDAEAMRGLFAEEVTGFPSSFVNQEGEATIAFGGLEDFLESVGSAEPGSLDEQIIVRDVIVDDNLVTVVTPYTFTYQGNLSHCGVDVFLIARQGEEWKIAGLADTRRRADCGGWLDE